MIGANAEAIATAEDRERFKEAMVEIGLDVPRSGIAHTSTRPHGRRRDRLPVIIRPAYILGGAAPASPRRRRVRALAAPASRQPDQRDPRSRSRSPAGRSSSSRSCATAPTTA
jgi:hypothetical protein